jgi:anthranilate phosphoribosyltransferase
VSFTRSLAQVLEGRPLSRHEAREAVGAVLAGEATAAQLGAFLAALRVRGETVEELTGAAEAVRAAATRVVVAAPAVVDTCGTGGDGRGTFNISTAAAIVASAGGAVVAKHGNRSVSSRCGSADVLEALGARLDLGPEAIARLIGLTRLGFLFAPAHHPTFKHVVPVRRELGVRTLFNLIGPLSNPAGATRQVMGVFEPRLVPVMAEVLLGLGTHHALVVHGDGLDEISVCGPTLVEEVRHGRRRSFQVTPEELGLGRHAPDALQGGDAAANAAILWRVLDGEPGAPREAVLANAAAALFVADEVQSLHEGVARAAREVDSGAAAAHLERFLRLQHGEPTVLDAVVARTPLGGPRAASPRGPRRSLSAALSPRGGPTRVIAEVKRRSPSAGPIAPIIDPGALAEAYVRQGAAAISVLTNGPDFGGSLDDLAAVRARVDVPVLRKEFIVGPRQLDEAVAVGADAVLLIASVLGRGLRSMRRLAESLGLECLVEVHDAAELELALDAGATLVGINNRDLRSFEVDLGTTERLAPAVPQGVLLVTESGIRAPDDVARLRRAGVANFLVGEYLVRGGVLS